MLTKSDKQRAVEAIRTLPNDATPEDAIERLCFIAKVEAGLRDSEASRVTSHEDLTKQRSQ